MRYLRPKSLTWWAGCLALATGTGALFLPDQGQLAALARLVAPLSGSGDAAPMTLLARPVAACRCPLMRAVAVFLGWC
jgi:hypothetical protein